MKTLQELLGKFDGGRFQAGFGELIRKHRPAVVVETGVEYGVSTVHILKALEDNGHGHLYSAEPGPRLELEHPRWTLFQEGSFTALPKIRLKTGPWDFFLHDSDHNELCQTFEYSFAYAALKPGGILATDDHEWGVPKHDAWKRLVERKGLEEFAVGSMRYVIKPVTE